jgi:hypothetical protein
MSLESSVSLREKVQHPFSTACFGFKTENPAIRALDWLEKWQSEDHISKGLRGHLRDGVKSRRERFGGGIVGEWIGRTVSGYFNEPQGVVHLHTPYYSMSKTVISNNPIENWKHFFESMGVKKGGYSHAAYLMLDVPEIGIDNYKGKVYAMPDSVPREDRKVKALFVRPHSFSKDVMSDILKLCKSYDLPVFDLTSMEKVA